MSETSRLKLLEALKTVMPGLGNDAEIPSAACFSFGSGVVRTYNDRVSVRCASGVDGEFAVPAKPFYQTLCKMPDDNVDISVGQGSVAIRGSRRKATLRLSSDTAPAMAGRPSEWTDLPDDFMAAVGMACEVADKSGARSVLAYVHVKGRSAEASDKRRIAICAMSGEAPEMMVPAAVVPFLRKYSVLASGNTDGWLHFRVAGGGVFSCRTVGPGVGYPDLKKHFEFEGKELKLPDGMADAVKAASVLAEAEKGALSHLKLEVKSGVLTLSTEGRNGSYSENCDVNGAPDMAFYVSPAFMLHMAQRASSLIVGGSCAIFKTDAMSFLTVLMVESQG